MPAYAPMLGDQTDPKRLLKLSLANAPMLGATYYAQNYAGIIRQCLMLVCWL